MIKKTYDIPPDTLMDICKRIYRLEKKIVEESSTLVIQTEASLKSFGELIHIEVQPETSENSAIVSFKSESRYGQAIDWGKNLENETHFFNTLEKIISKYQHIE